MDLPEVILDTSFLEAAASPDPGVTYDLVIVGGGPAAMSAAIYGARKMLNLALITRDFGGQVKETSDIENWLGFQTIQGNELAARFYDHVKNFAIPVASGTGVTAVTREGASFALRTDDGETYKGRSVILATGKRHRPLDVPGEKELAGRGVAYCATCDAPLYRDKGVVVAGGGNSAFTTAIDLVKVNARVTLVNFTKGWQADESMQERITHYGAVSLLEYHQVVRIEGNQRVEAVIVKDRKDGREKRLDAQGIFIEIGLLPNSESVRDLLSLTPGGEVIIDCSCQTSVEGVFGAGDVTTVPHKQIIIAAGEGAKAALSAYSYLMDTSLI